MKKYLLLFFFCSPLLAAAQQLAPLSVDKIMRDPAWIGTSPSDPFWSPDGQRLYFFWNPGQSPSDSLYFITAENLSPKKVQSGKRVSALAKRRGVFNFSKSKFVFVRNNSLCLLDISSGKTSVLFETAERMSHLQFAAQDAKVVFQMKHNLYACDLSSGRLKQVTNFKKGEKREDKKEENKRKQFLENDALQNSLVLRRRKNKKKKQEKAEKGKIKPDFPKIIYTGKKDIEKLKAGPNLRFLIYSLSQPSKKGKNKTEVPDYVTESGYTKMLSSRPKAGSSYPASVCYIYDTKRDTSYPIAIDQIPGIKDIPGYYKDYPEIYDSLVKESPERKVAINGPVWNRKGTKAFVVVRSLDHKDRWIMLLQPETGKLRLMDRQHDSAWVAGPGIGYTYSTGNVGWIDEKTIWYQSEKTGYAHLYIQNVNSGEIQALTHGSYEVQHASLSPDRKTFYLTTNEVEPGQSQFYHLDINSRKKTRITEMKGGNEVHVSPDGKKLGILHSTSIHPVELYLKANRRKAAERKVTHEAESEEYKSYNWREPEIITFSDRDGFQVYASIYKPEEQATTKPGVIFIHGAGYLQDVKRSWSYYFREHFFMNLLADLGYTVMDIDYRGSAGYGRNWRTAIYRNMGEKDLEDIVDGAKFMADSLDVNPGRIGVWGGSYGGFLTLMALFKTDVFACGAALRSVTDWAHYNHGYTSNILNLPQTDSMAYVRSSPIYYAKGLNAPLLMCHGMIDTNVHFQDIVRLTEKLIELKKNDWELAVYPLEGHAFEEPESWRDEYTRILKLFEKHLK